MTSDVEPIDVVLDVDTGVDDALAILLALASPALRVRAITCVAGNVGVDQVVINTLKVLDVAGVDVLVARGLPGPISGPGIPPRGAHGADGMADLALPDSARPTIGRSAVDLLEQTLASAQRPVTVIALGPLTNIATLLRTRPNVAQRLSSLVTVSGPVDRRLQGHLDFNRQFDPEAADAVFTSGIPLVMFGLDVFFQTTLSASDISRLRRSPRPGARLASYLCAFQAARFGGRGVLGDASVVAALLTPDAVTRRQVVLPDPHTGPLNAAAGDAPAAAVIDAVDASALRATFLDALDPTRTRGRAG